MREDNPTVKVKDSEIEIRSKEHVLNVFKQFSGMSEGKQVEEFIIETIDPEISYDSKLNQYVLACYVYFKPIDSVELGYIPEEIVEIEKWERDSYMVGNNTFCVIYNKYL